MPFDVSKKATFNSALSMFRCMLRGPGLNFDMAESMKYAFHGLRAWLDTGLRQAGFSEDECTLALHWAKNSTMPRLYDRAGITSEVSIKTRLMRGYQQGWRQVADGTLPQQFGDRAALSQAVAVSATQSSNSSLLNCAFACGLRARTRLANWRNPWKRPSKRERDGQIYGWISKQSALYRASHINRF